MLTMYVQPSDLRRTTRHCPSYAKGGVASRYTKNVPGVAAIHPTSRRRIADVCVSRMVGGRFWPLRLCQIFEKMLETGKPIVVAVNKVSVH